MTLHLSTEDARLLRLLLLDYIETFEDEDAMSDLTAVATQVAEEISEALR